MSDYELIHRPVLAAARAIASDCIRLTPLAEGTVLQVFGNDVSILATFAEAHRLSLRTNGPGQWYLVGDDSLPSGGLSQLPTGLSVTDQCHGRVRIEVEGSAAQDVLAKGTGLDLTTLKIGDATSTLFGHITAHITRTGADRFELMPLRGFAESLWHDLATMAAEFRA